MGTVLHQPSSFTGNQEMRIILLITAEASSSSMMLIYVWFNEGIE